MSDIIRHYLEGRYFIHALEEKSTEILQDIEKQDINKNDIENLKNLLELSDLVKFAKYIPGEEENKNIVAETEKFINSTKMIYLEPESIKKQEENVEKKELVSG